MKLMAGHWLSAKGSATQRVHRSYHYHRSSTLIITTDPI